MTDEIPEGRLLETVRKIIRASDWEALTEKNIRRDAEQELGLEEKALDAAPYKSIIKNLVKREIQDDKAANKDEVVTKVVLKNAVADGSSMLEIEKKLIAQGADSPASDVKNNTNIVPKKLGRKPGQRASGKRVVPQNQSTAKKRAVTKTNSGPGLENEASDANDDFSVPIKKTVTGKTGQSTKLNSDSRRSRRSITAGKEETANKRIRTSSDGEDKVPDVDKEPRSPIKRAKFSDPTKGEHMDTTGIRPIKSEDEITADVKPVQHMEQSETPASDTRSSSVGGDSSDGKHGVIGEDDNSLSEVEDDEPKEKKKRKIQGKKEKASKKQKASKSSEKQDGLNDPPDKKSSQKRGKNTKLSHVAEDKDDTTIKSLKTYVNKCGVRKVWSKELAGLSKKDQIQRLKQLLVELGVEGRPTLEKCQKVKESRDMEAELKSISVDNIVPEDAKLTRRARASKGMFNATGDRVVAPIVKETPRIQKSSTFDFSFLGDQSSDSD